MQDLIDWKGCAAPDMPSVCGRFAAITPADFSLDAGPLFGAIGGAENEALWRYIPFGPFESAEALGAAMTFVADAQNWRTHIIREAASERALGMASFMRLRPEHGSAEVGCIVYSPALQRSAVATEAMYLMASHIFDDLGYRRYEWKCDAANAASQKAAKRLGFSFEGVFRNDMVIKGRNRDTAWFSMTDEDWPTVRAGFEAWLEPSNFDERGGQRRSLTEIRAGL